MEYFFTGTVTDIEIEVIQQPFTGSQHPSILFFKNSNFSANYYFIVLHGYCFSVLFYATGHELCIIINYLSKLLIMLKHKFYKHLDFRQTNGSVGYPGSIQRDSIFSGYPSFHN